VKPVQSSVAFGRAPFPAHESSAGCRCHKISRVVGTAGLRMTTFVQRWKRQNTPCARNSLFLWAQRVTRCGSGVRAQNFGTIRATRSIGRGGPRAETALGSMMLDLRVTIEGGRKRREDGSHMNCGFRIADWGRPAAGRQPSGRPPPACGGRNVQNEPNFGGGVECQTRGRGVAVLVGGQGAVYNVPRA
jgi:hypothetical protein